MQFGLTFYPLACVFLAVIAELAFRLVGLAGKRLRFPFGLRPFRHGWCGLATTPKSTR
jgi:hypothetical protein